MAVQGRSNTQWTMKAAIWIAAIAPTIAVGPAYADARGNQLAYNYAMRCFVAGGILAGQMRRRGDTAEQIEPTKRDTKVAFDLAYKAGEALGYTPKRIADDMDGFQRTESRRLVLESGYMDSTREDCVKLGLMEPSS